MNESLDWNQKAKVRDLINEKEYEFIFNELQKLPKAINSLILYTNQKLKSWSTTIKQLDNLAI